MRPPNLPGVLIVLAGWAFLASAPASGQTSSQVSRCPATLDQEQQQPRAAPRPKSIVDSLTFDGPVHLPDAVLETMIIQLKQCEFDDPKWLDEVLELWIRGTWQDEGYFRVVVNGWALSLGGDATHQHFSVKVHVDEGLQYRLGNMQFRVTPKDDSIESTNTATLRKRRAKSAGDSEVSAGSDPPVFPVGKLRGLIPLEEGDILSAAKIREGIDNLKRVYGEQGYMDFTATPFTEVDDEHHSVDIRMELDEQMQFHISKIEIQGLDAGTQAALVWKIRPGDVFNNELFEQFFEDNKSLLPAGSSEENAELRRDRKQGTVDVKMRFRQ